MTFLPLVVPVYTGTPRFVVAATGQQILLRGVNTIQNSNVTDRQATVLSMGCNMVRVVTDWSRLALTAPSGSGTNFSTYTPNIDATALSVLDSDLQYYHDNGIYYQLDFHQASWSPYFGGDGIPSWYYTDSRFQVKQNSGSGWTTGQQGSAISAWWIDANESPMSQTLYISYVSAIINHILSNGYSTYCVGYEVFNEPNPGGMGGTDASKTSNIHTWLAPVVDAINVIDPNRAKFIMNLGGGQGYGTSTFSEFTNLITQKCVLEYHAYYTGLAPGVNASGTGGGYGASSSNDEYYPSSAAVHNTTSGSTYAGAEIYQEAFLSVPIAKAASLGIPLFYGEQGVHPDDTGRLQYISDVQTAIDNLGLSSTVWKLGRYPTDNLGLMNSGGSLLDTGLAWQTWFQNTTFLLGGSTPVDRTDSATGVDSSLNRRHTVDSATGVDVSTLKISYPRTDTATGADASIRKTTLPRTDTATGADVSHPKAIQTRTDSASGVDASHSIRPQVDSASGSEASSQTVKIPRTEVAAGSDVPVVFGNSTFFTSDPGSGSDVSIQKVTYARTDSALGSDVSKVNQQKLQVDSATGLVVSSLKATQNRADSAASIDVSSLHIKLTRTDTASAVDISDPTVTFLRVDTAVGVDAGASFPVHVVATVDSASGDDESSFVQIWRLKREMPLEFDTATPIRLVDTLHTNPKIRIGMAPEFDTATPIRFT